MKVVFDTSVIVEIDRKNEDAIKIIKKLIDNGDEILISTITVSEILVGPHFMKNFKEASIQAKRILSQFLWIDFNGIIAEKTAQYIAFLISENRVAEYQDAVIAATCKVKGAEYLITLNKKHFDIFPDLKNNVYTIEEFKKILKK